MGNMRRLRPRTCLLYTSVIGPWTDEVLLDWYSGTPPYAVTILEGIREAVGVHPYERENRAADKDATQGKGVKVLFDDGSNPAQAAELAAKADVAIVVVGNHPVCNAAWASCPTPSNGKEGMDRKTIVLELSLIHI